MTTPRIKELRHLHERSNYEYLFTAHGPGAWAKRKDYIKTMRNVLPLLLDVVEAAQEYASHLPMNREALSEAKKRGDKLREALAALDGVVSTGVRDDPGDELT